MSSRAPSSLFGSDRSIIQAEIKSMEEVECPLCLIPPEPFAVDYQGFQLCRCPSCDLQFLSPRPTFEQLSEKVYNETYHGIIFISVPNIAGLSTHLKNLQSYLHLKRRRWRHYAALYHLWFFTPKTLRRLIEHAGLRVLQWETPVFKKEGQSALIEAGQRQLLERMRSSSILDFYCTLD